MCDPTITTEHPELVSVERGSQVQYRWAFLTYEPMIRIYAFDIENKWKFANEIIGEIKFNLFMYETKRKQMDVRRIKPNSNLT